MRTLAALSFSAALIGIPGAGHAQDLTFADLHGKTIEARVAQRRQVKSDLGTGTNRADHVIRYTISADGTISHTHSITITLPSGQSNTRHWKVNTKLEQPHEFRDGQSVLVFQNNALVRLRTLDQGGSLLKIQLAGTADKLTCKVELNFAREEGVGKISSKSVNFGTKVQILSSKEAANSCRVHQR